MLAGRSSTAAVAAAAGVGRGSADARPRWAAAAWRAASRAAARWRRVSAMAADSCSRHVDLGLELLLAGQDLAPQPLLLGQLGRPRRPRTASWASRADLEPARWPATTSRWPTASSRDALQLLAQVADLVAEPLVVGDDVGLAADHRLQVRPPRRPARRCCPTPAASRRSGPPRTGRCRRRWPAGPAPPWPPSAARWPRPGGPRCARCSASRAASRDWAASSSALHAGDLAVEAGDLGVEVGLAGRDSRRSGPSSRSSSADASSTCALVATRSGRRSWTCRPPSGPAPAARRARGRHRAAPTSSATASAAIPPSPLRRVHFGHASNTSNRRTGPEPRRTAGAQTSRKRLTARAEPTVPTRTPTTSSRIPVPATSPLVTRNCLNSWMSLLAPGDPALDQVAPDPDHAEGQRGPGQALDQALEHERDADEPVGGPHQLHHRHLPAAGEDRHADGVEDQQRRRRQQHRGHRPQHDLEEVGDRHQGVDLLLGVAHAEHAGGVLEALADRAWSAPPAWAPPGTTAGSARR